MDLFHLLHLCACNYNINIRVIHITSVYNETADSLSRFHMEKFRKLALKANILPDDIPEWPTETFTTASCKAGIMALPSQ